MGGQPGGTVILAALIFAALSVVVLPLLFVLVLCVIASEADDAMSRRAASVRDLEALYALPARERQGVR